MCTWNIAPAAEQVEDAEAFEAVVLRLCLRVLPFDQRSVRRVMNAAVSAPPCSACLHKTSLTTVFCKQNFELTQLLKSAITAFEATDKTVRAECRAAVGRKMVHSAPSVVLDAVFEQLFSLAQQDAAVALQRLNADASTSNDSMESAQGVMLFLGCLHSMAETRLE